MKKISPARFFPLLAGTALGLLFLTPEIRADTPMEKSWERLAKAFAKLRDGLKDPQDSDKDTYVQLGEIIRTETKIAMVLDPKMLKNVTAPEQEAFRQSFRRDMAVFEGEVDKLNAALQAGQWPEAQKIMVIMGKAKKDGHAAYREKKDKK